MDDKARSTEIALHDHSTHDGCGRRVHDRVEPPHPRLRPNPVPRIVRGGPRWAQLACLALVVGCATAHPSTSGVADARPTARPPGNPHAAAATALYEGRPLEAVETLRAYTTAMTGRPAGADSNLLQYQAFVSGGRGPLPLPLTAGASAPAELDPGRVAALRKAEVRDALVEIVARARDSRIVIINEAHDTPRHRAFALEVARALRPLGFSLLAIEALATAPDPARREAEMAALVRRGHPDRKTGFYIHEPVFGDFVRQALALGYQPVAYEETGADGIEGREEAQARNLAARIHAAGPETKILVYVGYSHVAERPLARDRGTIEWMAARLKRITGIDPLTIAQTGFLAASASNAERAYHALVAPKLRGRPAVLVSAGAPMTFGKLGDAVDLHIVHPAQRLVQGRPDWYRALGRVARPIPASLRPKRGKRLIRAYLADEPSDTIPIDQVVAEANRPLPVLMLPPGKRIRYGFEDPPAAMPPS